jgi:nucleotide-binding universal stress UspA family protein
MITIQRILCPVDLSSVSSIAVDYATSLAKSYGAVVHLLHMVPPMVRSFEYAVSTREATQSLKEISVQKLEKLIARTKDSSVIAGTEVRVGNVYDEIEMAIQRVKPDLVVMGTHGRRGIERWFAGSTTEKLLRHTPVPLVTIPGARKNSGHPQPFRRILITTDFSAGTAEAVSYGFSLAQENQSKVTLLHVINEDGIDLSSTIRDEVIAAVQKQLEDMVPAGARNWCEVVARIETGKPYLKIVETLETDNVDVLVMNIHGKGMLDRALIGSTAERVVRTARCPVMLIPPMKRTPKARTRRIEKRAAA